MYAQEKIKPYSGNGHKREQVERMFDTIAHSYDLLNHSLSWGIDRKWRRKSIDSLRPFHPERILDIATGTGDFAILSARRLNPRSITGADISEGMMQIGREKVRNESLEHIIRFQREDCAALSFPDNTFDAVTVAYGVRNFENLDQGLREIHRVLKPGGHLLIVELCTPVRFPMKQLFRVYSRLVMPVIGRLISRDNSAYTYLPATMAAFPQGEVMQGILRRAGFSEVTFRRFTGGLCTRYLSTK
ncbi:MAG: bifunctional demethylmenaquinone methyltransferase/2-methoxy-6-polyprenyl-1,4-benzoquinol methylase UbiE [Paraprevotella sp.]|nr:bifunctional demethylmenaquinone methyltransferase/2-methoxy-6-polyprenyl-1,4-benzoquinol methylase UbiE [Paraprevotella sp.]